MRDGETAGGGDAYPPLASHTTCCFSVVSVPPYDVYRYSSCVSGIVCDVVVFTSCISHTPNTQQDAPPMVRGTRGDMYGHTSTDKGTGVSLTWISCVTTHSASTSCTSAAKAALAYSTR